MDVYPELNKIGSLFQSSDLRIGLDQLWQLWASIPEPKIDVLNAYLIIEYGVAFSLKIGALDEAKRWAKLAPQFRNVRQDLGEVEFLMGRVAYEDGDLKSAAKEFLIANKKSRGRIFEGREKKYIELIR